MRPVALALVAVLALPLSLAPTDAEACAGALRVARRRVTDPVAVRSVAALDAGKADEALVLARRSTHRGQAKRAEGLALAKLGRWKAARLALEESQLQGEDDTRLRTTLAEAADRTGEHDTARGLFTDLWNEGELPALRHRLRLAELALDDGDTDLAAEVIEALADQSPKLKQRRLLQARLAALETARTTPTAVAVLPAPPSLVMPMPPVPGGALAPLLHDPAFELPPEPRAIDLPFDATAPRVTAEPLPAGPSAAPVAARPATPNTAAPSLPADPRSVERPEMRILRPSPIGL